MRSLPVGLMLKAARLGAGIADLGEFQGWLQRLSGQCKPGARERVIRKKKVP
jgi:hypothetical protein